MILFRLSSRALRAGALAVFALVSLQACQSTGGEASPAAVGVSDATPQAAWTRPPERSDDTLRFAIMGDRTGLARPGVFEQAVQQVDWMHPEFVINVGDLIEGYVDDRGELVDEWKHVEKAIERLEVPFVFVAGNHDTGNDLQLQLWRERRGAPYYHFIYKNVLFLVLDTEDPPAPMPEAMARRFRELVSQMQVDPAGAEKAMHDELVKLNEKRSAQAVQEISAEDRILYSARFGTDQVEYALRTLRNHPDVRWTFVLMHKPAWELGSPEFARIEEALAGRPYTVIAGHNHYFTHEIRRGRDYFKIATTGAATHQMGKGNMDQIAWVTVADGNPSVALIRLDGLLDADGNTGQTLLH